jgi:hypothetical protein
MDWGQIKTNLANLAIVALLSFAVGMLFAQGENARMGKQMDGLERDVEGAIKRLDNVERRGASRGEFLNCVQLALQSLREGNRTDRVCELKGE